MMPSLKGFGFHFTVLAFSGIKMVGLFQILIMLTVTVYRLAMHEEERLRKGPWLEEEDELLTTVVSLMGERRWDSLAEASGLRRSGKSCRMRWLNYLHPNLKRGRITAEEEQTIILLHEQWGNKWSKIAHRLPGRTDNEIKNYWRCHVRKKGGGGQVEEEHKEQSLSANCSSSSGTTLEMSNYSFSTSSPYETQLSDWMISSWTDEQSFMNNDGVFSDQSEESDQWGWNSSGCLWVWDTN